MQLTFKCPKSSSQIELAYVMPAFVLAPLHSGAVWLIPASQRASYKILNFLLKKKKKWVLLSAALFLRLGSHTVEMFSATMRTGSLLILIIILNPNHMITGSGAFGNSSKYCEIQWMSSGQRGEQPELWWLWQRLPPKLTKSEFPMVFFFLALYKKVKQSHSNQRKEKNSYVKLVVSH